MPCTVNTMKKMIARDLIVIGTSAGGVEALQVVARGLPRDLQAAVLIVIHLSAESPYLLPEILRKVSPLEIANVSDGVRIESGKVYVAPPDCHLLVKANTLKLSKGPKENRSRPAIDPLFRTAAAAYGPRVIGVILTGMLDDGSAGLSAVKECGGTTVVQDPADALYPSMPQSALRYVGADYTVLLAGLAPLLTRLVQEPTNALENVPRSKLNQIESRFSEMSTIDRHEMDAIGSQAGVSCPECHGPMWKIKDGKLQRYRCHVGHAYTAQTMAEGQIEAQEAHLWQALRLMKERISLIGEMRRQAEDDQRQSDIDGCDGQIRYLEHSIAELQGILQCAK